MIKIGSHISIRDRLLGAAIGSGELVVRLVAFTSEKLAYGMSLMAQGLYTVLRQDTALFERASR